MGLEISPKKVVRILKQVCNHFRAFDYSRGRIKELSARLAEVRDLG